MKKSLIITSRVFQMVNMYIFFCIIVVLANKSWYNNMPMSTYNDWICVIYLSVYIILNIIFFINKTIQIKIVFSIMLLGILGIIIGLILSDSIGFYGVWVIIISIVQYIELKYLK